MKKKVYSIGPKVSFCFIILSQLWLLIVVLIKTGISFIESTLYYNLRSSLATTFFLTFFLFHDLPLTTSEFRVIKKELKNDTVSQLLFKFSILNSSMNSDLLTFSQQQQQLSPLLLQLKQQHV